MSRRILSRRSGSSPFARPGSSRTRASLVARRSPARRALGTEQGRQNDDPPRVEVQSFFRPEFFNRIDQMVTFRRLESTQIRSIAEKELADLAKREGLLKTGVRVTWTPGIVELIVDKGFDSRYGARPLQRTLERLVVTPLARWLVENPGIRAGTLTLDVAANAER